MTGFGRGELGTEIGHLTVEVRSVNHRACNIVIKLPESLPSLESRISSYIRSRVSRGQISISVNLSRDGAPAGSKVILDRELAKQYCEQLIALKEYLSLSDPINLSAIASLPGVISIEETKDTEEIWPLVLRALTMAVDQLIEMRKTEGAAVLRDLSPRLENMSQLTERIGARAPKVVEEYRQRLRARIDELLRDQIEIDESRIAMEVAIMSERCDITEEIVRLRSHICQIRDGLKNSEEPVGRHLDFILQEVNREVNTVASKASDVQISADCISFKDEIEKMREQVQNIE
jgi:uncharacterized protein (TIGR00255 family)